MTQKRPVTEADFARARRARRRVEAGGEHAPRAALAEAVDCLLVLRAAAVLRGDAQWTAKLERTLKTIAGLCPGIVNAVREGRA